MNSEHGISRKFAVLALLCVTMLYTLNAVATVITVNQDGTGDYTSIQAGINASSSNNGDTVLVWPGTYFENIEFNGKYITIASLYILNQDDWYKYNTIIDGNQEGASVLFNGGTNIRAIEGFTIRNGKDDDGYGGVKLISGTGIINNCIIENNYGCGIAGMYCTVYLSGTTIRYNKGEYGGGGIAYGLYMDAVFDSINRCNIYLNYGVAGCEIAKSWFSPPQTIWVDTFTVINPDIHFLFSYDTYNIPVNDMEIHINHAYLEPVNHDLYVNPVSGSNTNSGVTPDDPLKTIAYANSLIKPDSISKNNIYLANGLYSTNSNDEALPIGTRSFVSLIGESRDSTILDAEHERYFYRGFGLMQHCNLENITLMHGKGAFYSEDFDYGTFQNIILRDGGNKIYSGFSIGSCDSLKVINLKSFNIKGNASLAISNSNYNSIKSFEIRNCVIDNNKPGENPLQTLLYGGGVSISGAVIPPSSFIGAVINIQITNNLCTPDPQIATGYVCGLITSHYCKINLINASIGYNVLEGGVGFGTSAQSGAELNIYSSILHGDSLRELSMGHPMQFVDSSTVRLYFTDIEGGYSKIVNWNGVNTLVWGEGNMSFNPLWDTTSMIPYALPWNSPCINAGTPMFESGMNPPYIVQEDTIFQLVTFDYDTIPLPANDLAGNPRIVDGRIDMGAFEFQDTLNTSIAINSQVNRSKLSVYPNPADDQIFFEVEDKFSGQPNLIIIDIQGKMLISSKLSEQVTSIEVSHLQNGIYFYKTVINGKFVTGKIVIKK